MVLKHLYLKNSKNQILNYCNIKEEKGYMFCDLLCILCVSTCRIIIVPTVFSTPTATTPV
jgi:hypothetical protein